MQIYHALINVGPIVDDHENNLSGAHFGLKLSSIFF